MCTSGVPIWREALASGVADAMGDEPSRWRTFGERVDYDNPWVWLGEVDVELPGVERFWHDIVRLHRAAVMMLVESPERAGHSVEVLLRVHAKCLADG